MTCVDGGGGTGGYGGGWLFVEAEATRRAILERSELGGLLDRELVVDLFCGAGGWGEGAKELGVTVDHAINHDAVAIFTHAANNPGCGHERGDAWRVRPRDVMRGRPLGLLMASAACTTHSRARGAAPISPRVHMLGWCIARWMREAAPRVVLIENVPEWKDWGPTVPKTDDRGRVVKDDKGRVLRVQCPDRKGQAFRRWWRYCVGLGYVMEMRVLDAPDYGAASRRRRLFIIARRDGMPIVWPEATHGGVSGTVGSQARHGRRLPLREGVPTPGHVGVQGHRRVDVDDGIGVPIGAGGASGGVPMARGMHPPEKRPYRTAAECIDWSDLGRSIFERPGGRPLKPKTLARIVEGVRRFVLEDPAPFVLRVTQTGGAGGGGGQVWAADGAMPCVTTRQDLAVCTPILSKQYGGERRSFVGGSRIDEPMGTLTAIDHHALATPVMQVIRGEVAGRDVRQPMPTITAGNGPGRGAGAAHALGVATPILATTGYGEREGQAARVHRVAELLGTCVDGVKQGVVTPVLMNNTSGHTGGRVDRPGPTVTTGGQTGLVAPVMAYMNHGGKQSGTVNEPLRTVVGGGNHAVLVAALMMEYYGNSTTCRRPDAPLGAVTTLDRHGLVCCVIEGVELVIVDILFRMLRPLELARAMGFRADYVWPKTQRDTVRLIGNAVAPPMARALVGAALPRGRGGMFEPQRGTERGPRKAGAA